MSREEGFASLSSVTVKRSIQLKMDTNEDCAFIFDNDFWKKRNKITRRGGDVNTENAGG